MEITLNANFFAIENGDLELINGGNLLSIMCGLGVAIGSITLAIILAPSVASLIAASGVTVAAAKFLTGAYWVGSALISISGLASAF